MSCVDDSGQFMKQSWKFMKDLKRPLVLRARRIPVLKCFLSAMLKTTGFSLNGLILHVTIRTEEESRLKGGSHFLTSMSKQKMHIFTRFSNPYWT